MKRFILLVALAGLTAATPQLGVAQPDNSEAPDAVAASAARVEIQAATESLNAALKSGDAAGALQWLAPDFELGRRQYRVRDLAWMKTALPLQLQSARYTKLSTEVTDVEFRDGIAATREIIDAGAELKAGVRKVGPLQSTGTRGSGNSEWEKTASGWRLKRANDTLELLLFAEAPPAPMSAQPTVLEGGTAAGLGFAPEKPLAVLERRDGQLERELAFSPDSRELAFNYDAQNVTFASTQSGETVRKFAGLQSVNEMAYANDGSLWTADNEGRVRQIDVAGKIRGEWKVAEQYRGYEFGIAPNGSTFAVATSDQDKVQLWDAASGQVKAEFTPEQSRWMALEFSPDSSSLARDSWSGAEVHSAADGALLHAFKGERWGGFAPDGELSTMKFAGSTLDRDNEGENVLYVRDAATGEIKRQLPIPMPWSAAQQKLSEEMDQGKTVTVHGYTRLPTPLIAPDGKRAASIYYDGTIGIWDTQSGEIERVLLGFFSAFDNPPSLAFSPDGKFLAVSSRYGEVALWDVSAPAPFAP